MEDDPWSRSKEKSHNAGDAERKFQQGEALHRRGNLAEAEALYKDVLSNNPDHFGALHLLGVVAFQTGRLEQSVASFSKATSVDPNSFAAHCNLGAALNDLKRHDDALESYDRAIYLNARYIPAHYNRAISLQKLGRLEESVIGYDKVISLKPDYAEAYNNRGFALQELKRIDEAIASYDRAIHLNPNHAETHYNRGNALAEILRLDEAVVSYDTAISLNPDHAETHYNRAIALQDLKRLDEAIASYDTVISLNPDHAEAHYNRAIVLQDLMRLDEAIAGYEKAFALKPGHKFLMGAAFNVRLRICDWDGLDNTISHIISEIHGMRAASMPFNVLGWSTLRPIQKKSARIWVEREAPPRGDLPAMGPIGRKQKINIGYYSADFRDHATPYLIAELFELHDRSRFCINAYSFGPKSDSPIRRRVIAAFDRFLEVGNRSVQEISQLSREHSIDVAVDLKGLTQDCRTGIFSYRAAPIQVNYLGYPGTMAAEYMDYIIADRTTIPESHREDYSEKIAYLPNSYQVNDSRRIISDVQYTRKSQGLPDDAFVFCCFNNNYKINPEVFDIWMRILKKVEGSVLWLFEDNRWASVNLRKEAALRGVDPGRLIFAPRMDVTDHLARHRSADLFLDTLPYNAHTTASDALWAGLPVLTRIGSTFAGRVAASLLNAIGLPELIAETPEAYEALAVELATDRAKLSAMKRKLAANRLTWPLFDTRLFTQHVERAYTAMYERYQAGLPPDHIFVEP